MSITAAVSRAASQSADPVRAVSVISTGAVEIHPEHAFGTRKPLYWWLLTSRRWLPPRPINFYVIEHANGLVLFDTGQDRASVTDRSYFPGGLTGVVYDRLARFRITEEETLTAQLAVLGYSPADVDTAILSHLHQDHIGGLRELTGADVLVSDEEWEELSRPAPEPRGFLRKHILIPGLNWHRISLGPATGPATGPEHGPADESVAPFTHSVDLMGDGSLTLLPTPGHTAGSLSLLIRRRTRPPLLLVGDLSYSAELLERRQIPGVGDRKALADATGKVLALKKRMPGLVVLPAHDPTAAQRLLES